MCVYSKNRLDLTIYPVARKNTKPAARCNGESF